MLPIHGTRAALPSLAKSAAHLGKWLRGLVARAHCNVAIVALIAKPARIGWASLQRNVFFEPSRGGSLSNRGDRAWGLAPSVV
ncbi:hypothetical protein JJC00_08160 [Bradyrhizobium diazoefficiens]|nr:hypothetical protein [Bradyrhizobium diazoefficiens]QQO35568.1 hypothetical protein JJC00_08160 [Bradyrhizobium diazoefficiens]